MISQQRALVRMPEVVGLPLKKAKILVESAGLTVDSVMFMESYEARDLVLSQKPTRGQMVYSGEKVTLGVSRESYVKWLPSIYHRPDINGKNFIRDLLWVVQHLYSSIEEKLDNIHSYFDPYEAPEDFLPWLASWSAMVVDEDWPLTKKRRLIKKAIEMYRIRGTVKGLTMFISLFTGHEPTIYENIWPFKGWRLGVTSETGVDTVVLPPVNLAHTFVVEMPVSYKDLSPEAVIRIHEIIRMEKPANTQYYLRFATEEKKDELREFMVIGQRSGIGIGTEGADAITSEEELQRLLDQQGRAEQKAAKAKAAAPEEVDDGFTPQPVKKPPLPKAPRADNAPVEGKEVRTGEAGGFGSAARQMEAISVTQAMEAVKEPAEAKPLSSERTVIGQPPKKDEKKKDKDEPQKDPKDPKKK